VIIGVIFVVCVMVFRRGFVGEIERWFGLRLGRSEKAN
jgi:ABC-type branched-subunit amino acid transport system permease subunit